VSIKVSKKCCATADTYVHKGIKISELQLFVASWIFPEEYNLHSTYWFVIGDYHAGVLCNVFY